MTTPAQAKPDKAKPDKAKPRKAKPRKAKKKPPVGLAVFTEAGTVPAWMTAARVVMVLAFAAAVPMILGVEDGRRLFWAAAIAILPVSWVVGGYHLWRRICPLAVVAQLARLLGRAGSRRPKGWLASNYMALQLGVMIVALSLRLIMTNGTPIALVGFVAAATVIAIAIGFVYTGKTWCNYVCPVGMVEKFYTEPTGLGVSDSSQCSPCTACKKNCPDIDLEQGYWKEVDSPARRLAYYAWPGIVLAFYVYYYFVAGNWDYYFSGAWTLEDNQIERWLEPGLYFLEALPVVVAAPLTLLAFGAASYALCAVGEKLLLRIGSSDADTEGAGQLARHRMLSIAGFVAFIVFYFFGGQPTIRLAPPWVGSVFGALVVVAGAAVFFRNWSRTEQDFVHERFARKILKKWEWGDAPPSERLQDIYVLHNERARERKARLLAYKETVREMVADGIVTRNEVSVLDSLRSQLGITEKEHKQALAELTDEERQLFDPDYQGSVEQRVQQQAYQRELERLVIAASHNGALPDDDSLAAIRTAHNVTEAEQDEGLAAVLSDDGPVAAMYREQVDAASALADAYEAASAVTDSSSFSFLRFLCRWRGHQRAAHALDLLVPLSRAEIPDAVRTRLFSDDEAPRTEAVAELARLAGEERVEPLARQLMRLHGEPTGDSTSDDASAEAFRRIADDASAYVRAAAVYLLTRFDDEASRDVVTAATDDPDPLVRESAFCALGVRGRLRRELMAKALDDPDPRVKAAAVGAVAGRGSGGKVESTAAAVAAAGEAHTQGVFATLDANAGMEKLTSLEKMMLVHGVSMFATLDPDDLEECTMLARDETFAPGQVLCRQGDPGDEVFLIISGEVEAIAEGPVAGSATTVLGTSGPGSTIGEMAVFDAAPRSATVAARSPARALVVEGDAFRSLLRSRPAMSESIIAVLVARLRGMIRSARADV